jgi:hypothetical protein
MVKSAIWWREFVVALLSSDFQVVGAVSDGQQLVQAAIFLQPDVIKTDRVEPAAYAGTPLFFTLRLGYSSSLSTFGITNVVYRATIAPGLLLPAHSYSRHGAQ